MRRFLPVLQKCISSITHQIRCKGREADLRRCTCRIIIIIATICTKHVARERKPLVSRPKKADQAQSRNQETFETGPSALLQNDLSHSIPHHTAEAPETRGHTHWAEKSRFRRSPRFYCNRVARYLAQFRGADR
jgi:hypothetical protein